MGRSFALEKLLDCVDGTLPGHLIEVKFEFTLLSFLETV